MQRFELSAAATVSVVALIGAAISHDRSSQAQAQAPGVNHAVGYYDPTLRRAVLVSGAAQPTAADRDRVWSWSGARWDLVTDSGPPARGNAGAAYDEKRRFAVVTGGAQRAASGSGFESIADTWEGHRAGWRHIAGTEIAPRDHNSLVFDEARGTVVMFGGMLGDRSAAWPSDTWELTANGWARIATEGPVGRGRTALAYDSKRNQVVLFGGVGAPAGPNGPQPFFSDTWVWERGSWRKVADGGPRGRYAHGMVYDEGAGVVLLYSGAAAHRDAPLTDMWQWDGTRWTEIRLTGPTPGFRYQPVMIYDKARGRTVLIGGYQGQGTDTWEWDGRAWKQITP